MGRIKRGHVSSALLGLIVGVVVFATLPVLGSPGDSVLAGRFNDSGGYVTRLKGKGNPTLRLINWNDRPGLEIRVKSGTPPLAVNSSALVDNLNADHLDGKDASAFAEADHVHDGTPISLPPPVPDSPVIFGPAAFHGVGRMTEWINHGDYIETGNSDESEFVNALLYAPLSLPDGAEISSLKARIRDASSSGWTAVRLMRAHRTAGLPDTVDAPTTGPDPGCRTIFMISSGQAAAPGNATITDGVFDPPSFCDDPFFTEPNWRLVDNTTWTYYLQIEMWRVDAASTVNDERLYYAEVSFTGP